MALVDDSNRRSRLPAQYRRWTSDRYVPSLGTNDGAEPIAFQAWHKFKEAFPPELVVRAIGESPIQVRNCLDPFAGSGTTPLTCQFLGLDSTVIEVNPFLADVIRAKLAKYNVDELVSGLAQVRRRSRRRSVKGREFFNGVPHTFIQPGLGERWIFSADVADRLASILSAVQELPSDESQRFFRVLVGGLLTDVSNVTVSGKGRRYRRNWKDNAQEPDRVDQFFAERAGQAIRDVQTFCDRPAVGMTVICGDCRQVTLEEMFDLAVFSPPYPNSFDYTDVYNLELWMLGYLGSMEANRILRRSTLSSHVQLSRVYAPAPAGSSTLDSVLRRLTRRKEKLWDPRIPSMLGAYFADLVGVIDKVMKVLRPGAKVWMIVGDSRYAGVIVPVARIVTELAEGNGWTIHSAAPIRHMKSSAQQGRLDLAESMIVLSQD
jgi:DNA modification methylase